MLERTHIAEAPWWEVQTDDEKQERLDYIHNLLDQMLHGEIEHPAIVLLQRCAAKTVHASRRRQS